MVLFLTFHAETWTLTKGNKNQVQALVMKYLSTVGKTKELQLKFLEKLKWDTQEQEN